jgi:hypothetical protein
LEHYCKPGFLSLDTIAFCCHIIFTLVMDSLFYIVEYSTVSHLVASSTAASAVTARYLHTLLSIPITLGEPHGVRHRADSVILT